MNRSRLTVAAAALSVIVVLGVAISHANPPLAHAAGCNEYKWIGDYALTQDDGWRVEFTAQGQGAQVTPVVATSPSGETLRGTLAGSISGDHINFDVHWDNNYLSKYSGYTDKNNSGFVHGGYLNVRNNANGQMWDKSWDSTVPLGCADETRIPPGQLPIPAPDPVSTTKFDKHLAVDCPQPYSQTCSPRQGMTVKTSGPLFVTYTADGNPPSCAPGKARIFIDGNEWGSAVVQPGQDDGGYYIDVTPASHAVEVQMDGVLGGCNTGAMSGWSGTLHVETDDDAKARQS